MKGKPYAGQYSLRKRNKTSIMLLLLQLKTQAGAGACRGTTTSTTVSGSCWRRARLLYRLFFTTTRPESCSKKRSACFQQHTHPSIRGRGAPLWAKNLSSNQDIVYVDNVLLVGHMLHIKKHICTFQECSARSLLA